MRTIKNLTTVPNMDPRFLDLVKKKEEDAICLYFELEKLLLQMNGIVDEFLDGLHLEPPFTDLSKDRKQREPFHFFFSAAASRIEVEPGLILVLEAELKLTGWEIYVFPKPETSSRAKQWLDLVNKDKGVFKRLGFSASKESVQAAFKEMAGIIQRKMRGPAKRSK